MERLRVSEAAKLAGVGASTVRRWIQINRLPATRNSVGDWEVEREALMGLLSQQPTPASAQPSAHHVAGEGDALRLALDALQREKESLERERRIADDLRAELRDARAESRSLLAEMRALLAGGLETVVSRWMRVPPPEPKSVSDAPVSFHEAHEIIDIDVPKSERSSGNQRVMTDASAPLASDSKQPPKGSPFARECMRLAEEGRTPEEIAKILGKSTQNVKIALRSCK